MLLIPYGETSCCRWYTTPYRRYMNSHTRRTRLIPSCSLAPSLSARKWDRRRGILWVHFFSACVCNQFCVRCARASGSAISTTYRWDERKMMSDGILIALIEDLESSLGLVLNRHKCELYSKRKSTEAEFEGFQQLDSWVTRLIPAVGQLGHLSCWVLLCSKKQLWMRP